MIYPQIQPCPQSSWHYPCQSFHHASLERQKQGHKCNQYACTRQGSGGECLLTHPSVFFQRFPFPDPLDLSASLRIVYTHEHISTRLAALFVYFYLSWGHTSGQSPL